MEGFLEKIVIFIANIHGYILSLNDAYEKNFTDKELHFLVIGVLGIGMLCVIYPLFKLLSKNHILTISFIYVLTVIIGLTFAIEIGQKISGTGTMEFGDIVFGITGFILFYVIFVVIREIVIALLTIIKKLLHH